MEHLLPDSPRQPTTPATVEGRFVNAATDETSELQVTVDAFDGGRHGQPVIWAPRPGPQGPLLPRAGDIALITRSNRGRAFVIAWYDAEPRIAAEPPGRWEPGDIKTTARLTPATGWLRCDGQAVTVAMGYPELRAALLADGSPYGSSSGDPRVPNLNDRVPLGRSGTRALGAAGGAETHTLTTPEIPAHTHTTLVTAFTMAVSAGSASFQVGGSGATPTGSTGGGGAHNNMQPYLALTYVIKA